MSPLVSSCFKGYNGTVLAYGQTGSGKTFTMSGSAAKNELHGMIPRAIESLFKNVERRKAEFTFALKLSYLEIHNDDVRDLLTLSDDKTTALMIRENPVKGVTVAGLTEHLVSSATEMAELLQKGSDSRATAGTEMNATSSRSHAICTITVEQTPLVEDVDGDAVAPAAKWCKLRLVDLAGSERQKRTKAQGARLKEGININRGLLALGNVISALGDPKRQSGSHVPYRDSKLTRLLQDSLGGNSRTIMLACISPSDDSFEETVNTLRYANRARNIQNKAVVNCDPAQMEIAALRQKVQLLQLQLLQQGADPASAQMEQLQRMQQQHQMMTQSAADAQANSQMKAALATLVKRVKQIGQSLVVAKRMLVEKNGQAGGRKVDMTTTENLNVEGGSAGNEEGTTASDSTTRDGNDVGGDSGGGGDYPLGLGLGLSDLGGGIDLADIEEELAAITSANGLDGGGDDAVAAVQGAGGNGGNHEAMDVDGDGDGDGGIADVSGGLGAELEGQMRELAESIAAKEKLVSGLT